MDKKDLFSESDPFFTVSRHNPDDSYTVVYRSDYIKDEPAPSWPPVTITSDKLCNGDWNRRLKVEIFDYNDRYVQYGPSSMSYLDLLAAVLLYTSILMYYPTTRVTKETRSVVSRSTCNELLKMKRAAQLKAVFFPSFPLCICLHFWADQNHFGPTKTVLVT